MESIIIIIKRITSIVVKKNNEGEIKNQVQHSQTHILYIVQLRYERFTLTITGTLVHVSSIYVYIVNLGGSFCIQDVRTFILFLTDFSALPRRLGLENKKWCGCPRVT